MAAGQNFQDPLVGRVIDDRYQILERIGEGGMGVVYKARQVSIDRLVAIKVLNQQMAQDPTWVQRFNNEARACSQLQHPNTIRMFEFGQTREGRLFMAMEFLDGQSLRQVIASGSPMHPARVIKILIQCCASLAEAHSLGIIHRDIKPDNVFLLSMAGSPDFVKLLDFSVAKLLQDNDRMRTQAGVVFGTPQYMSPEQGRGLPLDARSDIYALGILAFEMLTGQVPFNHENPMIVLQMHIRQPLPQMPPHVPPQVQAVVAQALDKDPGRRYQSSGEMMQHCQQIFARLGAPSGSMPSVGFTPPPGPQMGGSLQMPGPPQHMGGPRHMPGPPNHMGGPPQPPGPPHGYVSDASAKTIIGGQAPNVQELLRNQTAQAGAAAGAKTMIAGMGMPGPQHPGPGPQQGFPPQQQGLPPQQQGFPPQPPHGQGGDDSGMPKTMMLQDSEGVVSFAKGQSDPLSAPSHQMADHTGRTGSGDDEDEGASPLFWAACLITGIAAGVLAYLAVLWLS